MQCYRRGSIPASALSGGRCLPERYPPAGRVASYSTITRSRIPSRSSPSTTSVAHSIGKRRRSVPSETSVTPKATMIVRTTTIQLKGENTVIQSCAAAPNRPKWFPPRAVIAFGLGLDYAGRAHPARLFHPDYESTALSAWASASLGGGAGPAAATEDRLACPEGPLADQ
jgi:hypothetical protein